MSKMVYCQKLQEELPGLDRLPYPGPIGQRIYEHISKDAWGQWLSHQTLLINENRLNVLDPAAKQLLLTEMEKFLFGDGCEKPQGFVPPEK